MILADRSTQEVPITPSRFASVDYGDVIPTSGEHQKISGCTHRGGISARYFISPMPSIALKLNPSALPYRLAGVA